MQENSEEKEEAAKENGGEEEKDAEKSSAVEEKMEEGGDEKEKKEEKGEEAENDDAAPKPRPLHKTSSIFLRNLAPTITTQEVSYCMQTLGRDIFSCIHHVSAQLMCAFMCCRPSRMPSSCINYNE